MYVEIDDKYSENYVSYNFVNMITVVTNYHACFYIGLHKF